MYFRRVFVTCPTTIPLRPSIDIGFPDHSSPMQDFDMIEIGAHGAWMALYSMLGTK
jgi:hypothetical protein